MAQVRLSVFYPQTEGASFDENYYRDKHVPLAVAKWKPSAATIEKGLSGPVRRGGAFHLRLPGRDERCAGWPGHR